MTIRTPDDEVTTPGYFYPPFTEGWTYEGQTYGGHTDYSVDWNRRTKTGGWLEDRGDPVYAQQDGTVAEVDKANGAVFINHFGGAYRTESRHMDPVLVKVGQKVQRGDLIGRIGAVGISPSSGFTPSPHLHVVHWKKVKGAWQRIQQSYEGKPVRVSVGDSDSRPKTWNPPAKVYLQGPPPKATWESAYREALALAEKRATALDAQKAQTALAIDERDRARRLLQQANEDVDAARAQVAALDAALTRAQDDLAACQQATPPDCSTAVADATKAEHARMVALMDAFFESVR